MQKRVTGATYSVRAAVFAAANLAESKKGFGTVILDIRQVSSLADYFLITGGDSPSQVKAIADSIDEALSQHGYEPRSVVGKNDGRWVLLDYGDIIVHVLHTAERNYYKLEQFWNHALIVDRQQWASVEDS